MRLAALLGPNFQATLAANPDAFREALADFHEEDIAEGLADVPLENIVVLLRALPRDVGSEVLERLESDARVQVIERLQVEESARLVAEMAPDDRTDLLQDLEAPLREQLLAHLDQVEPEAAEEVRELNRYPEGSVGAIMTSAYVGLAPDTKVWKAIDEVRRASHDGDVETIYYVYVVAFGERLVGVVSLRELILADPSQELADVMTENVVRLVDTADQEEAARMIAKYDFHAMPVVDALGKMLGLVTVDDVVDVVISEATEDAQRMGAVSPIEAGYLQTRFGAYFKSRVVWLVVLFLGGFLTANVMHAFEGRLQRVITLAMFIPLIISTGGNAGSQSATLVIRALSLGEVAPRDWLRVLSREAVVALALGAVVGALGFLRAFFAADTGALGFALVVGTSIVLVVTVGSLIGCTLPLLIQRLGFDPAVSSTPFIASISDVVGLLVYLTTAAVLLD